MPNIVSKELPTKVVEHLIPYFVIIFVYAVINYLLLVLLHFVPGMFSYLGDLSSMIFPFYHGMLMIIAVRLISSRVPEINTSKFPSWLIILVPMIILTHPMSIITTGKALYIEWSLGIIFRYGNGLYWMVSTIIYLFSAYTMFKILYINKTKRDGVRFIVMKKMGNQLFILLIVGLIILHMLYSAITDGLEVFDLAYPVKYLVIYLFANITAPQSE
jgi:hypothetical protein